jgi:hypothetical protein
VSPAGSEGIPSLPGVPPAASAQAAARVLESVTADEFTINRGETHGVREGDSYRVEGVDREVRDEGGRVIFRHTRLLGTAQVVEVRKEVSRLKLVQREEGKAAVKAGDMVSPLAAPSGPPAAGG